MGKSIKLPLSGANWNNVSDAGVFARNLNNASSNSNNNVGGSDSVTHSSNSNNETVQHRDGLSSDKRTRAGLVNLSSNAENLNRPKRTGYLYDKAFTKPMLYQAFLNAKKGKSKKVECFEFELNLGAEMDALHKSLMDGSYKPQPLRAFEVFEPKRRLIHAPHFRDLVVQHAIYQVIYPIFDRTFIDQSYACRKGGGTHKASEYTQRAMRKYSGDSYYAKLDIRKFFYRVDRAILRKLFERKIKDKRFLDLMCVFAEIQSEIGIPIGNLLSQIYALIYLNPLDHFVKRILKAKHYVRYVDDFIAIGLTLSEAKLFKEQCERFVKNELKLELSHWTINKIKRGINFVGYRSWRSVKFVRKHSVLKFKKSVKQQKIDSVISLIGHAKHSATINFYARFLNGHTIFNHLPKGVQQWLNTINSHQSKLHTQRSDLMIQAQTV
ncbi:MAG: hypothetical protein COW76_05160 [Shewanella sp. CG18_big_fil_WC_8_21_14_2_50_42_11]|uniref:reverse transcriptase domain-containing protein n=1 Tax=Shewanella sp. CG18_big_fil_WC_8_21_14_2_50_42_11 TaxID=1975538 RepID=UPI000C649DA7|nr:reverse transcriptase domain-containing protein [Shewanella sp. CG18_big_fil_WC_8_21_14_2_50_42_11]PIQ01476.1 MAG: hypothetical protein COW76_05160 [Shewanella sp. CG18_big_fil_WC_8_21_14_2_50_42_11]